MPAGTVPTNFPPRSNIDIGEIITGISSGNTAALATTVFFTAPVAGWYLIAGAVRITATNGAGTLTMTITTPHAGTITMTTPDGLTPAVAIAKNALTSGGGLDGYFAGIPVYMAATETIRAAVAVSGLTGTTYDVVISAQKLL